MGGYRTDFQSPQVRLLSFASMRGSIAAELATDIGIALGEKLTAAQSCVCTGVNVLRAL
jgi:hypothetical protein